MTDAPETFSVYIDAAKYPMVLQPEVRGVIERVINDRLVGHQKVAIENRATVWRFRAPTTETLRDNPMLLESFLDHLRGLVAGVLAEYARLLDTEPVGTARDLALERLETASARANESRGMVA